MAKTFDVVEKVGISTKSLSDAIKNVLSEQKDVAWFEVREQRGRVKSDGEVEFQVTLKIGRRT